uniref:Uncharacterized protein n=1 Tax=viral metagenome TaxID=1070528 RepID=A0A6C0H5G4_9ZZZZ
MSIIPKICLFKNNYLLFFLLVKKYNRKMIKNGYFYSYILL